MRLSVFSAKGRTARMPYRAMISSDEAKIDGHGRDQPMHSAAVRHGFRVPARTSGESGAPCVGSGQTMAWLSRRAIMKRRLRMVGAP